MAYTLNSNSMGVYITQTIQTDPLTVINMNPLTQQDIDDVDTPAGDEGTSKRYLLLKYGKLFGIAKPGLTAGSNLIDASDTLVLVGAATSTAIDTTASINEVAARTGVGISQNFIASSASSWNCNIDGLVYWSESEADAGYSFGSTPTTMLEVSTNKYFVIVKYVVKDDPQFPSIYWGQGLVESCNITSTVDDIATYSVSIKGYGPLYATTVN